jgi:pSer/pThr/pTyr-binding forkhead associated (FHA) protein
MGCPRCGKENQDHYKFCLGCGAELPRASAGAGANASARKDAVRAPLASDPATDLGAKGDPGRFDRSMQLAATQQGDVATGAPRAAAAKPMAASPAMGSLPAPLGVAPPRSAQPGPPVHRCPACSNPVPADFKFCGTCGHRIGGAAPIAAPQAAAASPASPAALTAVAAPAPSPVPAASVAHAQPAAQQRGKLVLINPDGSEGAAFPLYEGPIAVGRNAGRLFAGDAYLSPVHATFILKGDGCLVRDEQSLNGVYVKLARDRPARLSHGDVFRIGQEIIRFEQIPSSEPVDGVEIMGSDNPGYLGRISLIIGRASIGHAHTIAPDGMYVGRERGDVIFPEDGYVSGLHCRIHRDGTAVALTDIGSSNGTFLRVRGERKLVSGELVLMGQQLFRLQY